jgi:hypothetical protein
MNRRFAIALATALLSMAVVFALKSFAETLFLAHFGATYLPHFLVAQALALMASSSAYGALLRRRDARAVDLVLLGAQAVLCGGASLVEHAAWRFLVPVALLTLSSLTSMALWNAVGAVASGRRARSFLPRAGAAATAGAVIGGFGATAVVGVAGWDAVGPTAALLTGVCIALRLGLPGTAPEAPTSPAAAPHARSARRDTRPLLRLLGVAAVLEALLATFVDFGFKQALLADVPDADRLGLVLSLFYGTGNVLLWLFQLLLASRLLARQSLHTTLAIAPAALTASSLVWLLAPGIAAALATRGLELVLKFGIARPAQEIAMTPLRESHRRRWKVLLRGVHAQVGSAAAGLALLLLAPLHTRWPGLVAAGAALLAAAWLALSRRVARHYLDRLGAAIGLGQLAAPSARESLTLDRDGVGRLVAVLASGEPALARLAEAALAQMAADPAVLVGHLAHPDPAVRAALYRRLAAGGRPGPWLSRLRATVAAEASCLAAGLRALAAHRDGSQLSRAQELVSATGTGRELRIAASIYLAGHGALTADPAALRSLLAGSLAVDGQQAAELATALLARRLLDGPQVEDIVLGAISADRPTTAAGTQPPGAGAALPAPRGDTGADATAGDPACGAPAGDDRATDGATRAAGALAAAAVLGRPRLLAALAEALVEKRAGAAAAAALVSESAMPQLVAQLCRPGRDVTERLRVARLLRHLPGEPAVAALTGALRDEAPAVRGVAAHSLQKLRREHGCALPERPLQDALAAELELFALCLAARPELLGDARETNIQAVYRRAEVSAPTREDFFHDELERSTEQILSRICGLLALLGPPAAVLGAEHALRSRVFKQRRQGMEVLQEVVRGAQRRRLVALLEEYLLPEATGDAGARARVTAANPWLARCASDELDDRLPRLVALRASPLFEELSGEALLAVADRMRPLARRCGQQVVAQGQTGATLYLLLRGTLRVERDDQVVAELQPGHAFGELALIDGRPRQASVRAVGDCELLQLSRPAFDQLLAEQPEIGLGLLRSLTRWLRG